MLANERAVQNKFSELQKKSQSCMQNMKFSPTNVIEIVIAFWQFKFHSIRRM